MESGLDEVGRRCDRGVGERKRARDRGKGEREEEGREEASVRGRLCRLHTYVRAHEEGEDGGGGSACPVSGSLISCKVG